MKTKIMNRHSKLRIVLFAIVIFISGCTVDPPVEECDTLVYGGSFLHINELTFCPESLKVQRIIRNNQGSMEEKIICNFTTDNGTTCKNDRLLNAQIVIRTSYPNTNNVRLPNTFRGTYAELKALDIYMDVMLIEESDKTVFYEIDLDELDDELFVEIGLNVHKEFISCRIKGNILLGPELKTTSWESVFMFMD